MKPIKNTKNPNFSYLLFAYATYGHSLSEWNCFYQSTKQLRVNTRDNLGLGDKCIQLQLGIARSTSPFSFML